MAPDRLVRDVLRDVEGVDMTFGQLVAGFRGRRYDRACNREMQLLWNRVGEDGCVMANPLRGQLEGDGWHVYVQIGERGEEFEGATLLEAVQLAIRKTEDWPA